ncbi:MAG: K+/H+ antiporter subunit F [Sandaracinobacter sp.]|jgi:multicomponent K+:H+ antiporter subunit F
MLSIAIPLSLAMIALAIALNLWRLFVGPDATDRILALDTLTINAIALVLILGIALGTSVYFEAALILAMMGFVGTVALCKYLLGGDIIE